MSNDQITVVNDEMRAAGGQVLAAKEDVDSRARTLNTNVNDLAPGWRGAGGSAFQQLMEAWNGRLLIVTDALNDFKQALEGAGNVATENDQDQEQAYRSMFPGLDGNS